MQTIGAIMTGDGARRREPTTLFDLMDAIQQVATNDPEVVATVLHMMEKGLIRWSTTSTNPIPQDKDAPAIRPPYIMNFRESEHSLSIRSTSARGQEVWICNDYDYSLLLHLCYLTKHRLRPHLYKSEVCGIYQCQLPEHVKDSKKIISQQADSSVNTFRRRVRRLGINPHRLLIPVRCIGWQLHPEVRFIQFPSVDPPSESREVYGQSMIDNMRHPAPYPGEEP